MSPVATISPVVPVAATPTPKLSNCTSEVVVNPPLKLTVEAVAEFEAEIDVVENDAVTAWSILPDTVALIVVALIKSACKFCTEVLPEMFTEPVNVWTSSDELPNAVEPDSNITDDVIYSVLNSCAVIVPVTVKLPDNVSVVLDKYDDVCAVKVAILVEFVSIDDELAVTLLANEDEAWELTAMSTAKEELSAVDEPDMSSYLNWTR